MANPRIAHISYYYMLRRVSPTWIDAAEINDCLKRGAVVPHKITMYLMSGHIYSTLRLEKDWIIVDGFPETVEQLQMFEEKVSEAND